MIRLGILASGRGSNARAILQAIETGQLNAEASVVICNRDGAGVVDVADRFDVPWHVVLRKDFPTRDAQQLQMLELLKARDVDFVALAGFTAILKPPLVAAFPNRMLNIHPSLLPAFAGGLAPEPQAAALRAGVKISGCTVHVVTDDLDAGPIVAQAAVPVLPDDTVETLVARILVQEHRLYPAALQWFAEDRVRIQGNVVRVEPKVAQGLWASAEH